MSKERDIGAEGEKRAQLYLRRKGYLIRETNWSSIFGELDIIAEKNGALVFVEVKTRRGANTDSALAGITAAKRERMIKAVYQYLDHCELDWESPLRLDVIAVALDSGSATFAHVEDAFDW